MWNKSGFVKKPALPAHQFQIHKYQLQEYQLFFSMKYKSIKLSTTNKLSFVCAVMNVFKYYQMSDSTQSCVIYADYLLGCLHAC